ncbi:MAG: hypothetical protein AAFY45_35200 [Bacteroidota bacterium]
MKKLTLFNSLLLILSFPIFYACSEKDSTEEIYQRELRIRNAVIQLLVTDSFLQNYYEDLMSVKTKSDYSKFIAVDFYKGWEPSLLISGYCEPMNFSAKPKKKIESLLVDITVTDATSKKEILTTLLENIEIHCEYGKYDESSYEETNFSRTKDIELVIRITQTPGSKLLSCYFREGEVAVDGKFWNDQYACFLEYWVLFDKNYQNIIAYSGHMEMCP